MVCHTARSWTGLARTSGLCRSQPVWFEAPSRLRRWRFRALCPCVRSCSCGCNWLPSVATGWSKLHPPRSCSCASTASSCNRVRHQSWALRWCRISGRFQTTQRFWRCSGGWAVCESLSHTIPFSEGKPSSDASSSSWPRRGPLFPYVIFP